MDIASIMQIVGNPVLARSIQHPEVLQKIMARDPVFVKALSDPMIFSCLHSDPDYLIKLAQAPAAPVPPPPAPVAPEPVAEAPPAATYKTVNVTCAEYTLMQLYGEFMKEEEGKKLAWGLDAFAKFMKDKAA